MNTLADFIAAVAGVSKSQARRLIEQGAIRVNGIRYMDPNLAWPYRVTT